MLKRIKFFTFVLLSLILVSYSNSIIVKCKNITLFIETNNKYKEYICDFLEGKYIKSINPDIAIDLIRNITKVLVEKNSFKNFSKNLVKVFYKYAENLKYFCYKDEDCLSSVDGCISKIYLSKIGGYYFKKFGEKCICYKNKCVYLSSLYKVEYFKCKNTPTKFIKCVINFSSKYCISNESIKTFCNIIEGKIVSSDEIWKIIQEYLEMKKISKKREIKEIEKTVEFLYENIENTHCFICGGKECRNGESQFIINLPNFTLPKCICENRRWICIELEKNLENDLIKSSFGRESINCSSVKEYLKRLFNLNILNNMKSGKLKKKSKNTIIYLANVCNLLKVINDKVCVEINKEYYECFEKKVNCSDYSNKESIIICANKLKEKIKYKIKIENYKNSCEIIKNIVKNSNNLMEIISAIKVLEDMKIDPYKVLESCSLVDINKNKKNILYVLLYEKGLEKVLEVEEKKEELQYSKNIKNNILYRILGKTRFIEIPKEISAKISNIGILTIENISLINVEKVKVGNILLILKNPEEIRARYNKSIEIQIKNISLNIYKGKVYISGKYPLDNLIDEVCSKLNNINKVWINKKEKNFNIYVERTEHKKLLRFVSISCYKEEIYDENLNKIKENYKNFVCRFLRRLGFLR